MLPSPNAQEMAALLARSEPEPRRTVNPFLGSEVRVEAIRILEQRAPELLEPVPPGDVDAAWRRDRLVAEGGSVVGLAALIAGKVRCEGPVATILTGRNLDMAQFARVVTGQDVVLGDMVVKGVPYGA